MKMNLRISMLLAAAAACLHRKPNALVLANAATPPPAPGATPTPAAAAAASENTETGASKELARINKREKDIKRRIAASNGGLTREQAEAAYDHQERFTELHNERIEERKKKAAKK
jgi:hypothetical protein